MYNHDDSYVCEINNCLKSVLWKVSGEKNPIEGSQAPSLAWCRSRHALFAMYTVCTVQVEYVQDWWPQWEC